MFSKSRLLIQVVQIPVEQETTLTAELSERELEVLQLLALGLTNAEIAERL